VDTRGGRHGRERKVRVSAQPKYKATSHIARMVVQSFEKRVPLPDETDALTQRELEVFHGLSCGQPYKQISSELGISLSTVRTYIQRIYEKLHVHSQTEAVMKYARRPHDPTL
jgi:DNA-binding NarL/FixJ family response regulator